MTGTLPDPATTAIGLPQRVGAVLLVASAVGVLALLAWSPWPGRNTLAHADLAPVRDAVWVASFLDGILTGLMGVTFGLAVWLLVPARGVRWSGAAAVLSGLGGVLFAGGITARAFVVWYATAPELPAGAGEAVLGHVADEPARLYAVGAAGFLLVTGGILVGAVGLGLSRAAPRWLLVALVVVTPLPLVISPGADRLLDVLQGVQSLLVAGIGVLLWRSGSPRGRTRIGRGVR